MVKFAASFVHLGRDATLEHMKNKPFVFTLLSCLCFAEPLMKVLYFKAATSFDLSVIFANLRAHEGFLEVLDFWLIFPIAGLLIMRLRMWTYFGFISILGYNIFRMMTYEKYSWPYYSDKPFAYNYIVVGLSAAVILYFLSPSVRRPFFDRRARWWETMKRHQVEIDCDLRNEDSHFSSQVLNISKNGAFIHYSAFLPRGAIFMLRFTLLGHAFDLPVEVTSRHDYNSASGYGVRFLFPSFRERFAMARLVGQVGQQEKKPSQLKLAA